MVVVNGLITFDRVPFKALPQRGLDPNNPIRSPARQVVVQAIDGSTAAQVASTTTDLNGQYALAVPINRDIFIRARAQMLKGGAAPTWDFLARNNRNADATYTLDGTSSTTGTANSTRDLHAPSGWVGTSYTGERAAAPFAILDAVFQAKQLILAAAPSTVFAPLSLFWSTDNRPATPFCPDDGNIVTSSYVVFGGGGIDDCGVPGVDGIYILGDFAAGAGDTDEFDRHVIAHEFGHYIEDRFSRSDSIGGGHGGGDRLDLRVAFGEGWGNAFSAMALADSVYRDSFDGVDNDFDFNLEADSGLSEGWFSEFSVGEILWDIFDSGSEPGDNVALGFGPIHAVMTGPQVTTDALTSIFPFAAAIRSANPSASASIGSLLAGEEISGNDAFGASESNSGGDAGALPVYRTITLSSPLTGVCSASVAGSEDANKLGNRRFLRFVNDATRLVSFRADGVAAGANSVPATDPDIFVLRRGVIRALGVSAIPGSETISQVQLEAGTYIIEVYDFEVTGTNQPPRCMTVAIQG